MLQFLVTWTPLLLTIGLLTAYIIYAYYTSVFKPKNLLPTEKGYIFSNIVAYTYLGHKDHWTAIFYKLPTDINRFNHYMGHTFTKGLVFAGWVSTIMWLLINYTDYYKKFHSPAFIYSFIVLGCIWIVYKWNKDMYEQYLTAPN